MVVTFFFELLPPDNMGRECCDCHEWRERCAYSKTQWRRGEGAASCKVCTGEEALAAALCPTCGAPAAAHHGGCCSGTDIGSFSSSHKGQHRPNARPFGVTSFAP